jgi:AcrR family transcriptional regulator
MTNKTPRSPRGRPRAFTEADVLGQATGVFLASGFEATAYEDIAAATGLSKPSLYNAFGDKTALFEKVLDGYAAHARQQILATFASGTDIAGATRAMLLAAADVYAPAEGPSTGCLLVGTALPACSQHDTVQKTLIGFLASLDDDITGLIAGQHADEARRMGRTPRSLALQVTSLLLSLAVRARTGVNRRRLRAIAAELGDTLKATRRA